MKEIKAIIQPFVLEKVLLALEHMDDLPGLTVSEVRGWGKARARNAREAVAEGSHRFARKVKLEIVVRDDVADAIARAIEREAHTGHPGDGKIFVSEVAEAVKVRTGERGPEAL